LKRATPYLFQFIIVGILIIALAILFRAALAHGAEYDVLPVTPTSTKLNAGQNLALDETSSLFAGYPLLERISACESTGNPNGIPRQFLSDGSILWGNDPKTGLPIHRDVGATQINSWVWLTTAQKMGDDLFTLQGNVTFAKYLFDTYGSAPWSASRGCWQ
jgi:hypothetical protein